MVGEKKIEPPCLSRLSCRCVYLSLSHHVSLFLSPPLLSVFLSFSLSHHIFFSLSPHSCLYYYFSLSPKSCLCFYLSLFPTISLSPLLSVYLSVSLSLSLSLSHFCLSCTHVSATIFLSSPPLPVFLSFPPYLSLSPILSVLVSFSLFLSLPPFSLCNHSCLRFYLSISVSILICLSLCGSLFLSVSPSHPVSLYISLSLTPISFLIFFLSVALSH